MKFVDIKGVSYAVGLTWYSGKGAITSRKLLLGQARETCQRELPDEQINAIALRTNAYGLGHHEGPLPKVFSLAASLLISGSPSFVGVFNLAPQLWWVCGIYRGVVVKNGDGCYSKKEDAIKEAIFLKDTIAKDYQEVVFNTAEESLAYISQNLQSESRIETLMSAAEAKKRQRIKLLSVLITCSVIFGSYLFYINYTQSQEDLRVLRAYKAAAARKQVMQQHPEQYFEMPWNMEPPASVAGRQCVEAILAQPLTKVGWTIDQAQCTPGKTLVTTYKHNKGAEFIASGDILLSSPQQGAVTYSLDALPASKNMADALFSNDQFSRQLYQLVQFYSLRLDTLTWNPPAQLKKDGVILIAPWQKGTFRLSAVPVTAIQSTDLFAKFTMPGVYFEQIDWQSGNWTIQGVVYAQAKNK